MVMDHSHSTLTTAVLSISSHRNEYKHHGDASVVQVYLLLSMAMYFSSWAMNHPIWQITAQFLSQFLQVALGHHFPCIQVHQAREAVCDIRQP